VETVTFEDVRLHRAQARRLFTAQRAFLTSLAPGVEVLHVGSTAFESGLSRGDLDIQIRVAPDEYAAALAAIAPHYEVNEAGYTSHDAASFKDDDLDPPVGIILTAVNGSADSLWCFRDTLLARPDLAAEYTDIKARHQGGHLADYRAAKHLFVRRVMRTSEYTALIGHVAWPHRPFRLETARAVVFNVQDGDEAALARYHRHHEPRSVRAGEPDRRTEAFWSAWIPQQLQETGRGASLFFHWRPLDAPDGPLAGVARLDGLDDSDRVATLSFSESDSADGSDLTAEALGALTRFVRETRITSRICARYPAEDRRCAALFDALGFVKRDASTTPTVVTVTWEAGRV